MHHIVDVGASGWTNASFRIIHAFIHYPLRLIYSLLFRFQNILTSSVHCTAINHNLEIFQNMNFLHIYRYSHLSRKLFSFFLSFGADLSFPEIIFKLLSPSFVKQVFFCSPRSVFTRVSYRTTCPPSSSSRAFRHISDTIFNHPNKSPISEIR